TATRCGTRPAWKRSPTRSVSSPPPPEDLSVWSTVTRDRGRPRGVARGRRAPCSGPRGHARRPAPTMGTRSRGARSKAGTAHTSAGQTLLRLRYLPLLFAGVTAQRTDEGIGGLLFHNVCGPPGGPGHHEQWGERGDVKTHEVIGGARRIIEVGVNALTFEHRLLQGAIQLHELVGTLQKGQPFQGPTHGGHTRVAVLVHPMPKTHDLT